MSALRLGRLPDGTRQVLIQEPAVGRITHARGSITGGAIVAVPNWRDRAALATREYKERKTAARPQRTDYGWGIYAPEEKP